MFMSDACELRNMSTSAPEAAARASYGTVGRRTCYYACTRQLQHS
jgi:hypothetical protein